MTDHRVTDLSYGHLGEATYDIDTNEWRFSVEPSAQHLRQLIPLRAAIPPSIYPFPSTTNTSKDRTASTRYLVKSRPETYPANSLVLSHISSETPAHSGPQVGQLLVIGTAVDIEQTFGSRKTTIIATSCGEAGHVLQLIKPRLQRHEWGRQSSATLSTLDAASSDQGYWVGVGGRILQIACAEDGNIPTTRLAVRQANSTTIFRPVYGPNTTPAVAPGGYAKTYPASRINTNPIAVLTAEHSGSRGHADVTFNPWYSQQFAVVDSLGSWSIWDVEGGRRKSTCAKLIPGKSGNIYDGFVPNPLLKPPNNADGWHQLFWVGNVSTIVVCNRRHVAVFDVKSAPTRIQTREFFSARNSDWILDVKRSPSNLSHLFVLTSSRIFWLEVIPGEEKKNGEVGFRVLLSYRHFRDANDVTIRLAVLKGEDGKNRATNLGALLNKAASVTIFSERTCLLNVYTFSSPSNGLGPSASQTSLNLSNNLNGQDTGNWNQLQSLCVLDAPLKAISNRPPGPEFQYLEEDVKFYQLIAMAPDLGISSGLCTMHQLGTAVLDVTPPTRIYSYNAGYMSSKRVADEPWIIPDGVDENGKLTHPSSRLRKQPVSRLEAKDDQRFTINFMSIFGQAFGPNESVRIDESIAELFETILDRVKQRKGNDDLAMATFLELSQVPGFSEDLEQGAPILQEFLKSLEEEQDPEASSALVLSNLTLCPGIAFQTLEDSSLPDLLKVYDQVAENWIASLPPRVPGMTRLAKFKIARKIAVELCLSSIGASLRNKASEVPSLPVQDDGELPDPDRLHQSAATSREDSPALFSSQTPQSSLQSGFGLPTPAQTPSLYSQSHASASEYAEDPAISRLRQYAVSIQSKPDLGTSKILSHWPAAPGVDPATYSYEAVQKAAADESGEESDHRKRRDQARRKRKTERFLSRESAAPAEASSQPRFAPFGSQPHVPHLGFSSQTVDDVPMTQPVGGAFGSRVTQSKTKQKKKKAAGFR